MLGNDLYATNELAILFGFLTKMSYRHYIQKLIVSDAFVVQMRDSKPSVTE